MSAVETLLATAERVRKLRAVADDARHIPARQREVAAKVRVGDYGDRDPTILAGRVIRDRLAEQMAMAGAVERDRIRAECAAELEAIRADLCNQAAKAAVELGVIARAIAGGGR